MIKFDQDKDPEPEPEQAEEELEEEPVEEVDEIEEIEEEEPEKNRLKADWLNDKIVEEFRRRTEIIKNNKANIERKHIEIQNQFKSLETELINKVQAKFREEKEELKKFRDGIKSKIQDAPNYDEFIEGDDDGNYV